ncbi:MAG: DUF883 family protein [Opitutaceae bacterium]|nr:DUF883 family protein [Opitutaceae bacterium]
MSTKKASAESPEQIMENLRTLIAEAEKTLGAEFTEGAEESMGALRERLAEAKQKAEHYLLIVRDKVVQGAKQTDIAIRAHPYESLAIALGVGVLLGVLLGRKSSN